MPGDLKSPPGAQRGGTNSKYQLISIPPDQDGVKSNFYQDKRLSASAKRLQVVINRFRVRMAKRALATNLKGRVTCPEMELGNLVLLWSI